MGDTCKDSASNASRVQASEVSEKHAWLQEGDSKAEPGVQGLGTS